jgi:predicted Abi (CAAX) family protease
MRDSLWCRLIGPYDLFRLNPDREIVGKTATIRYLKKGFLGGGRHQRHHQLRAAAKAARRPRLPLQEGDQLLLNHNYGGVGGKMTEPAAKGPIYFGHFAYGVAESRAGTPDRRPAAGDPVLSRSTPTTAMG